MIGPSCCDAGCHPCLGHGHVDWRPDPSLVGGRGYRQRAGAGCRSQAFAPSRFRNDQLSHGDDYETRGSYTNYGETSQSDADTNFRTPDISSPFMISGALQDCAGRSRPKIMVMNGPALWSHSWRRRNAGNRYDLVRTKGGTLCSWMEKSGQPGRLRNQSELVIYSSGGLSGRR